MFSVVISGAASARGGTLKQIQHYKTIESNKKITSTVTEASHDLEYRQHNGIPLRVWKGACAARPQIKATSLYSSYTGTNKTHTSFLIFFYIARGGIWYFTRTGGLHYIMQTPPKNPILTMGTPKKVSQFFRTLYRLYNPYKPPLEGTPNLWRSSDFWAADIGAEHQNATRREAVQTQAGVTLAAAHYSRFRVWGLGSKA